MDNGWKADEEEFKVKVEVGLSGNKEALITDNGTGHRGRAPKRQPSLSS